MNERILVLAPTSDDARVVSQILFDRGLTALIVEDIDALTREIEAGAGVALIASEALHDAAGCARLRRLLEQQEPWSDLPVLLFGGLIEASATTATELLGPGAQIVFLERPLGLATFLTATDAALRSRRRQYEVKRLLNELQQSAAALTHAHEAADHAKDEFLATLAHELRSPMTAIRGWIGLLKTGELSEQEAAEALLMIESSAKVQAHIIEDLMDVSRILAGKAMIEAVDLDLAPVIGNVTATLAPSAAEGGIDLTIALSADPLMVRADEVRLKQIAGNLISNALKFTPRGGSVVVTVAREGSSGVVRVRDTGEGISAELLPKIFERYQQEEASPGTMRKGLGLGLAIVQHLVASHHGRIEVFSEGKSKGSEFVVTLPLLEPQEAASTEVREP